MPGNWSQVWSRVLRAGNLQPHLMRVPGVKERSEPKADDPGSPSSAVARFASTKQSKQ